MKNMLSQPTNQSHSKKNNAIIGQHRSGKATTGEHSIVPFQPASAEKRVYIKRKVAKKVSPPERQTTLPEKNSEGYRTQDQVGQSLLNISIKDKDKASIQFISNKTNQPKTPI